VLQKVALTPVVSSPMVTDDHSVAVLADQLRPVVATVLVTLEDGSTSATAVVFRDDGVLLTSAHALVGAERVRVVLDDGRRYEGTVLGTDLPTDVAVIAIDAKGLPVAVLGHSADLAVGVPVVALGGPSEVDGAPPVATGVISALERRLDVAGTSLHGLVQTDAPVGLRWSGGPLVDASGAVIGLTTGLAGEGAGFGFATPIDVVRRAAEQLLTAGRVAHAWLGIEGADLSAAKAEAMGLPGGAVVQRVVTGSPAASGGLQPGDVITDIDGRSVSSSSGLVVAMRHQSPGQDVTVGYWRDGTRRETRVTCDDQP
jgi:serine protease Do